MRATYFDGRTAHAHAVTLAIDDGNLLVSGDGVSRQDPIGAVNVSDVLGSTLRVLQFVDGASCEVADNDAFATMLAGHGVAPSRVSRWERSWRPALAALVIVLVAGFLGYRYGLPMFAERTANALPESMLNRVSAEMARALDSTVFSATKLPGERRISVLARFDGLVLPDHRRLSLQFRDAKGLGANAMALPSGAIYMTDQLVDLTSDDRVLMAVLAHEAGHVKRRHGLRQMIQGATVGALITWYFGDFSALGAAAPASLLQAKYSRDLEREADAYAAQVLKMNNLPVSLLADALELIQKSHGPEGKEDKEDAGALAYLSTHPATSERLAWLRSQR
jgi:Zn-dependent protease with chaperone function